jgi:hypothetical protein
MDGYMRHKKTVFGRSGRIMAKKIGKTKSPIIPLFRYFAQNFYLPFQVLALSSRPSQTQNRQQNPSSLPLMALIHGKPRQLTLIPPPKDGFRMVFGL